MPEKLPGGASGWWGDVSIRTSLKHRLESALAHGPRGKYCLGSRILNMFEECVSVNIYVKEFQKGFSVYVLELQGVKFNCSQLGVSLNFGSLFFVTYSFSLKSKRMVLI